MSSRSTFASAWSAPSASIAARRAGQRAAAWGATRAVAIAEAAYAGRGPAPTRSTRADALAALIETVGNDLRLLANEIDKLVTFVGSEPAIEVESLTALTDDIREISAFELARLLSAGDLAEALRAWGKFASSGEYPGLALGAILHHVRQLWRIKLAQHASASPERLARELNIPAFTVRRLSAQAAVIEFDRLRQWLEALLEADQTLKRSGLPPQSVFERLILRLCVRTGGVHTPA